MKKKSPPAACREITDAIFETEVLKSTLPVVVAFYSPWSKPCHVIAAALDAVAAACSGNVKVTRVNADNFPALSLLYDVQFIPTLLFFTAGKVRAQLVGTVTQEAIVAQLQSLSTAAA